MTKMLLYSDNHFSTYSSIFRSRGEKYSARLENQIDTINWIESLSVDEECDAVICLGDFFDRDDLSAEEISALKNIDWNENAQHVFLVGNHETPVVDNKYSSCDLFNLLPEGGVVSEPRKVKINGTEICYLPYAKESNRKNLVDLFGEVSSKRIILSHNDIKNINYGSFISQTGYDIEEIDRCCDLFINGHIHNEGCYGKLINIGNITGQNFNENCFKYRHRALIVDVDTLEVKSITNPYALNFAKVEYGDSNFPDNLPNNSIVTVKCKEAYKSIVDSIKDDRILMKRTIVEYEPVEIKKEETNIEIDHIKMFGDYCISNIGDSDMIREELSYVCK